MSLVTLKRLRIKNHGPIVDDTIDLADFTFFIGRNNAGKSHYLKAIESLLAPKNPPAAEIAKLQHDPSMPIELEGIFSGVADFTHLIQASNHAEAVQNALDANGDLLIVRTLGQNADENAFGTRTGSGEIHNPSGFQTNLLKVLPEVISIAATADTVDELKNTQSTALSRLKREVLGVFFEELKEKTQTTLTELDSFLHSTEPGERSRRLIEFEGNLKEELTGEFAGVVPTVEFGLPDQDVIAKEMKIFLDDGYRSEVEQKGHGLQRAALLALLKVLAKHGERYHDKPTPIFLIGELESFLHPYAQQQFGKVLMELVEQYQVVTTTHSPFIITKDSLGGYRRVTKGDAGSKAVGASLAEMDLEKVKGSLSLRGNLEGLFADRIVLVEGTNDQACFERLIEIFGLPRPPGKLTMFSFVQGKGSLWPTQKFYRELGLDDSAIIADLDYVFGKGIKALLRDNGLDEDIPAQLRSSLQLSDTSPALDIVLSAIEAHGRPSSLDETLNTLRELRVFILRDGSPENYYSSGPTKNGWRTLSAESDLTDASYLKSLLQDVLAERGTR
jgi:predicted ATP-dependent endonuclease of OLD family